MHPYLSTSTEPLLDKSHPIIIPAISSFCVLTYASSFCAFSDSTISSPLTAKPWGASLNFLTNNLSPNLGLRSPSSYSSAHIWNRMGGGLTWSRNESENIQSAVPLKNAMGTLVIPLTSSMVTKEAWNVTPTSIWVGASSRAKSRT